jgi:hypothetical protein
LGCRSSPLTHTNRVSGAALTQKEEKTMDNKLRKFTKDVQTDPRQQRLARAMMGLASGQIKVHAYIPGRLWAVYSMMSGKEQTYTVTYGINWETWDGTPKDPIEEYPYWRCNCPDFDKHSHDPNFRCKHIIAVQILDGGGVR